MDAGEAPATSRLLSCYGAIRTGRSTTVTAAGTPGALGSGVLVRQVA